MTSSLTSLLRLLPSASGMPLIATPFPLEDGRYGPPVPYGWWARAAAARAARALLLGR